MLKSEEPTRRTPSKVGTQGDVGARGTQPVHEVDNRSYWVGLLPWERKF